MDKETILKELNKIMDELFEMEDKVGKLRQDVFSLIDDIEIYMIDAES